MIGLAYFDVILFLHFLHRLGTGERRGRSSTRRSRSLPNPFVLLLSRSVRQMEDTNLTGSFLLEMGWLEVFGVRLGLSAPLLESTSWQCFSNAHSWACLYACGGGVCVSILHVCMSVWSSSLMCQGLWVACSFLRSFNWRLPCQAVILRDSNIRGSPLSAPRPISQKQPKSQHTHPSFALSVCHFLSFSLHLSLLLSKVFLSPSQNLIVQSSVSLQHFDIFPRLQKRTTTIGLWLQGTPR